jgi:multidrug efflux pump subunit AcrB
VRLSVLIALALLGLAGCPAAPSQAPPAREIVNHLELRVAAPGMSAASVEQLVVMPIELALVGNSTVRGMVSEAREGGARIHLQLSGRAELVAVDVLQRISAIELEAPVLLPRDPNATTLYVGLDDLRSDAARALIGALERTVGVAEVTRCGGERVIVIELDPERLRSLGIGAAEVEHALTATPSAASVEALIKRVVKQVDGMSIELADLASVRVESALFGCRAYSEVGASAAIGVRLNDSEARERVEAQLKAARAGGLALHRYPARLHVWLDPELEPEQVVEMVRRGVGAGWLLELGVEAEPCAGPGTLAQLHLADPSMVDVTLDGLAAVPGVLMVERPEAPRTRRWLVGPDLELLRGHGGAAGVPVGGEMTPELVVEFDRERLAALGMTHEAATRVLVMARGGVDVGRVESDRVMLRVGGDRELSELPISAEGVPLGMLAELRSEAGVTRICRRDGERGVVVVGAVAGAELPEGYRWLDGSSSLSGSAARR